MVFKLTVFAAILVAIAVLGVRGYTASVRRFEAARGLRGEGEPTQHVGSGGDMIVEVQVQTPTRLSKEQKELLCQLDELCQGEEEGFFSRLFHGARGKHKKKAGKEEKVAHG